MYSCRKKNTGSRTVYGEDKLILLQLKMHEATLIYLSSENCASQPCVFEVSVWLLICSTICKFRAFECKFQCFDLIDLGVSFT